MPSKAGRIAAEVGEIVENFSYLELKLIFLIAKLFRCEAPEMVLLIGRNNFDTNIQIARGALKELFREDASVTNLDDILKRIHKLNLLRNKIVHGATMEGKTLEEYRKILRKKVSQDFSLIPMGLSELKKVRNDIEVTIKELIDIDEKLDLEHLRIWE